MANCSDPVGKYWTFSFSELPEDVQLCILSFLSPSDLSSFACTSKRFVSLCDANSRAWYAMCDRRWGSETQIRKWGEGKVCFKLLYKTLSEYENLIGFWRRSGMGSGVFGGAPLVFFEWGPSCLMGSTVSPSKNGSYEVIKSPFIWVSLSSEGESLHYLKNPEPNSGLIQVSVSFMGKGHVVLEEIRDFGNGCNTYKKNGSFNADDFGSGSEVENGVVSEIGSPPDRLMLEMYQYFANRTSPPAGGERASRRQRRREKERQGRMRWDPEHLVKIAHCSPTPSRPLQGLWKGICDDRTLDFYLVGYDDIGGIACRRAGDSSKPFSGYAPVFWTSNATFIDSPFSHEEDYLYNTRMHRQPGAESEDEAYEHSPTHIMYINSSYDLVIPDLAGTAANPRQVEGRIWLYVDGTFGFGFLRNNFVVDLKPVALNGRLLDDVEPCIL